MSSHMRSASGANTLVGQPIERVEDVRFLLGKGQFADDYEPAGALHAAFFRSSVAHGRIVALDVTKARVLKGVHGIMTAKEIGPSIPRIPLRLAPIPGFEKYLQPVIASDKVRYAGEPIAVVVADSRAIAEDALELIEIDIEPLEPVADWKASGTRLVSSVRRERHQCCRPLHGRARRCRRGFQVGRLCAQRDVPRASAHRQSDGNARHDRRMARGRRPHDGHGGDQGQFSSTAASWRP